MKNAKIKMLVSLSLGLLIVSLPAKALLDIPDYNEVRAEVTKNEGEDKAEDGKVIMKGEEIDAVESASKDNFSKVKETNEGDITHGTFQEDGIESDLKYVKDQIIFRSNEDISFHEVKDIVKEDNGNIVGYIESINQYQVEYPNYTSEELQEEIDKLKKEEKLNTDTVGLNLVLDKEGQSIGTEPNDPWNRNTYWDESSPAGAEWGLEAIKALSAWQFSSSMQKVKVGVLEAGNFFYSEDLNFVKLYRNNPEGTDTNYHGNHVAGTIGAISNNNKGITGAAPNVDLFAYANTKTTLDLINNLQEAITKDNVKVLNYSVGYSEDTIEKYSKEYLKKEANDKVGSVLSQLINKGYDFIIASSAGNQRDKQYSIASAEQSSDITLIGGKGYEQYNNVKDRIITVGSVKNEGSDRYSISNFSQLGKRVDVMAPGEDIYSTVNGNNYEYWYGTSMASPHVAATAAMLYGLSPDLKGDDVKRYIVDGADRNVYYNGSELESSDMKRSYPVVNAMNSVFNLADDKVISSINGWVTFNGDKYYFKNGVMQTGWQTIDGKNYYFDREGIYRELKINSLTGDNYVTLNPTEYYLKYKNQMTLGQTVNFVTDAEGSDGDYRYIYEVSLVSSGSSSVTSSCSSKLSWTPEKAGLYYITVTVEDFYGNSKVTGLYVNVNSPLKITSFDGTDGVDDDEFQGIADLGEAIYFNAAIKGGFVSPKIKYTYEIVPRNIYGTHRTASYFNLSSRSFTWTPKVCDIYNINLTVEDEIGNKDTKTLCYLIK